MPSAAKLSGGERKVQNGGCAGSVGWRGKWVCLPWRTGILRVGLSLFGS